LRDLRDQEFSYDKLAGICFELKAVVVNLRFALENQVRTGLTAGGKWIRTIGSRPR
jgi:hypothetical protein